MTCSEGIEDSMTVTLAGNGIGAYGAVVQGVIEDAWRANPSMFTGGLLAKATVLSAFPDLLTVTIAVHSGDSGRIGAAAFKSIGSIALAAVAAAGVAAIGGVPAITAMAIVGVAGILGGVAGGLVWEDIACAPIDPDTAKKLRDSQTYSPPPRRIDPLVLDLNGNGLETVGLSDVNPLLFDHNADAVKTSTGWVSSNDGFLVWDRNGNGVIDNGRELFGDATVKSDGTLATDGFNALVNLDANGDGVVNNLDADFANLRVWRDLNQDGVSGAGEIFTLDSYQIAGINVANTAANTALGNGNVLNETGSYVRTDGSTGLVGDINFDNNPFYSQFTDVQPFSAAILALPDMQGAANDAVFEMRRVA